MLYLTLRQLEYVTAVARSGSLTQAAQLLNVSQPALSVAITQVEYHLGHKLFLRRKGSPIALAARGADFVAAANDLLARAASLENPAYHANRRSARIAIGCFEDLAPRVLAPMLREMRQALPEIEIVPSVADFDTLARQLQSGQIQVSITYDLGLDASFERIALSRVSPHAFFPPCDRLARSKTVSLKTLAQRPLILFDEGLSIQHILQLFKAKNLRPRIAHRVSSLEVMRSLAANGEGVGISYTNPPGKFSYDGKPVHTARISDKEAVEPIILARSALEPPAIEVRDIIATLQNMTVFRHAA